MKTVESAHARHRGNAETDSMFKESRRQPRETVALPVALGNGSEGETRDISATGLFFLTDTAQRIGSQVEIEIQLESPSGVMTLKAKGEVLRIEVCDDKTGVAVKLTESRLVSD